MNELVVISGKGGTGKTSITACLAVLAERCVVADCDVDAADLHLVLEPRIQHREEFRSGHEAIIRQADCISCGACVAYCRYDAVRQCFVGHDAAVTRGPHAACRNCDLCQRACSLRTNEILREMWQASGHEGQPVFVVDPLACEGCGVCVHFCPVRAIDFVERTCGEWFISDTRCGPMVHARLGTAAENSGKLVSLIRKNARRLAGEHGIDRILIDGSPGIGCPVIASITGAALVLIVTEPTPSGLHDLTRVGDLTGHFDIPTLVCINKWDINPDVSRAIETHAAAAGMRVVGRVRYDPAVTQAQIQGKAVVEHATTGCVEDMRALWAEIQPLWTAPARADHAHSRSAHPSLAGGSDRV